MVGVLGTWLECPHDQAIAATDGAARVTIPNFWDPKRRVERPAAGAVQAIRFVTTDDFPPFNFLDTDGRLTGFNVDLARAICTDSPFAAPSRRGHFDDLARRCTPRHADAAIAGIAITADSRADARLLRRLSPLAGGFVVRRDAISIRRQPGCAVMTLAVVARTAHEAYLASFFPEIGRRLYPSADAARAALKSGEVDVLFGDGIQLASGCRARRRRPAASSSGGLIRIRFFGEGMAIAVPQLPGPETGDQLGARIDPRQGHLCRALSALFPGELLLSGRLHRQWGAAASPFSMGRRTTGLRPRLSRASVGRRGRG